MQYSLFPVPFVTMSVPIRESIFSDVPLMQRDEDQQGRRSLASVTKKKKKKVLFKGKAALTKSVVFHIEQSLQVCTGVVVFVYCLNFHTEQCHSSQQGYIFLILIYSHQPSGSPCW